MLSQNQSRFLTTLVLLAIDCISALYFTATLFVGLKKRKKGAVAASAVCLIIAIASFFI